jgi:HlyD family secretion protein
MTRIAFPAARSRAPRAQGVAAAILAALLALACAPKTEAPKQAPKSVIVAPVARVDLTASVEYAARIGPIKQIAIVSKVPGRVAQVYARVGDRVRKDQALFTLEAKDYEAQFRQADAAYQSALANENRTNDSSLGAQVLQARAALDQAQVQYDDAKSAWDKYKRLFDAGAIAKQQFDSIDSKMKSASIQLEAAKDALRLIEDKSGPQAGQVVSAQADQAKAQADLAKSQLDNAVVRSPIDGVVFMREVEPGQLIGNTTAAFVVIDARSVLAETEVPDGVIGSLALGDRIETTVPGLGNAAFDGVVDSVSPAADPRTALYEVKIRFENPGGAIKSGMFARVRIPVKRSAGALAVPNSAVFSESGSDYVFVVADGTARKVRVELGIADVARTEIASGLAEGEAVVSEGQGFLNDGDAVIAATGQP